MSLNWNLSDVFLMIRVGMWVSHFWKMITEVKCHSHHFISSVHEIKMTSLLMSQIIFVRFINWKSTLCTLFICYSWTLVHASRGHTLWAAHTWRVESYVLPSKGLTIHISSVELFCMGDLSIPYIYVFIYEVGEKVISVLDCEFSIITRLKHIFINQNMNHYIQHIFAKEKY